MMGKLLLTLNPAETDPPLRSPEYQDSLLQIRDALFENGMPPSTVIELQESEAASQTVLTGSFSIELVKVVGPMLVGIVATWLAGRYGRKVRLKVGDIEAEARTVEEVETLLAQAKKMQSLK